MKKRILPTLFLFAALLNMAAQNPAKAGKPSGKTYPNWSRKAVCYIMEAGDLTINSLDDGVMTTLVTNGDSVYLLNPVLAFPTQTWAKGVQRGDTLIFPTPQPIFEEEYNGIFYEYEIARMVSTGAEDEFQIDKKNTEIRFLWKDGRIEQIDGGMIGIIDKKDKSWTAIGDRNAVLYQVNDPTITPLNTDKAETYRMAYKDEIKRTGKQVVKVIRDGDNLYIGELWASLKNGWIKGKVVGNKATFDSWQYLGPDSIRNFHTYAVSAIGVLKKDTYYFTELPNIVFTIDEANKTIVSEGSLLINCGRSRIFYQQAYMQPELVSYKERAATPKEPIVFAYSDYGSEETPDYAYVGFMLLPADDNDYELLTSKMSYRIYIDDQLYEFRPEEYPGLPTATTEIPYGFTNQNNMIAYGDQHEVSFKARYYKRMGVQAVYRGGGEERVSTIAWQESTGITNLDDSNKNNSVVYYDLMGCQMTSPQKGFYIKEVRNKSGKVLRTKHLQR